MLSDDSGDLPGLAQDTKLLDDDICTIQILISCLQRRVNWRATITPKKAPSRPAKMSKTATSSAARRNNASSPARKITSATSLDKIRVSLTTLINNRTSDVYVGSTTPSISSSISFGPRGDWLHRVGVPLVVAQCNRQCCPQYHLL